METCIGPHMYVIFTVLFLSCAYAVDTLEPHSISAKFIASVFVLAALYIAQKLIPRGRFKPVGKAVFITGCDTGFGYQLAVRCDQIGLRVFAGCLLPGKINDSSSIGLLKVLDQITLENKFCLSFKIRSVFI